MRRLDLDYGMMDGAADFALVYDHEQLTNNTLTDNNGGVSDRS